MTNNTYTIFVKWSAPAVPSVVVEELDIEAPSAPEARALAREELARDYLPGWVIIRTVRRGPGIFA